MENIKVINIFAIVCATISVLSVINTIRLNSDLTKLYKSEKAFEVYSSLLNESNSSFSDKIDEWDVSEVTPFHTLNEASIINPDEWEVLPSTFTQNIDGWDVSDIIFKSRSHESYSDVSGWDVSNFVHYQSL
jgi:hypothetical protein